VVSVEFPESDAILDGKNIQKVAIVCYGGLIKRSCCCYGYDVVCVATVGLRKRNISCKFEFLRRQYHERCLRSLIGTLLGRHRHSSHHGKISDERGRR